MIGAGALGCEYLKMFALMGLSTVKDYSLSVTDDDNIEVSNLNRQFLFRKDNVGENKAEAACKATQVMNPEVNLVPNKLRVGFENES